MTGPKEYRKKPVVIQAMQMDWDNWDQVQAFANVPHDAVGRLLDGEMGLAVMTKEGEMIAKQGDWLIRGVEGELYPCAPSIFAKTYAPADEESVWRPRGVREEVAFFGIYMEQELQAHDDRPGWRNDSAVSLCAHLQREVGELVLALGLAGTSTSPGDPKSVSIIASKCADVANMAMMVAEVSGAQMRTEEGL